MRLEKITVAQNGFIIMDIYGHFHIAKTLLEAAQIVGETIPNPIAAHYDLNKNATTLELVREEFKRGNKINAIKELKAINDTQAETINALTARIVALESKGTV